MKIKLIPDEVINLSQKDLLGTKVYVEALKNIIKNCDTPYTIGIFGSWGSGKSSIIKTLKEDLKDEEKIGFFIYDAWKYSNDDFRRTFILELRKTFGLDTKDEEELFYKDKIEDIKLIPKIDFISIIFFIITAGILILIYGLLSKNWKSIVLPSFSFSALLTWILSIFRNSVVHHKIAIMTPKLFAPEKFEEKFKKSIEEIIKKLKNKKEEEKKIIIAIDNIDRCHKEQVLEILQTIKTFLEIKNVVFLIPVDDAGLREFLEMPKIDADEFLRKIFNLSIKIKNFSEKELYEYGIKLAEKYEIDLPKKESVISLICQELTKNPRKIIQFLNHLQNEYHLAFLQEKADLIPKGSVTENIEILTKLLIIKEEYPHIYERLIDNPTLIQQINQGIREKKFQYDEEGNWSYPNLNIKLSENEYRFFNRTLHIDSDPNKLRLFLITKDIFKGLPDKLFFLVINQDWKEIKNLMQTYNLPLDKILDFIDHTVNEEVVKRKHFPTTGFNTLSLIFKIISEKKGEVNLSSFLNINYLFENKELWKKEYICNYPREEMLETAKYLYDKKKKSVCENIISIINETSADEIKKDMLPLMKDFIITFKEKEEILSQIKGKFQEVLNKDFTLINNEFKEIMDFEAIKYLISDDFVKNNILSSLTQDFNSSQTEEKVHIVKRLYEYDVLSESTVNDFVNKGTQLLNISKNVNLDVFNFWLETINYFLIKNSKKFRGDTKINIYNAINDNFNFIWQRYSSNPQRDIQTVKNFINLMGNFYLICEDENQKSQIVRRLNQFLNIKNKNKEVRETIFSTYENIVEKTDKDEWTFADFLINIFPSEEKDLKGKLHQIFKLMVKKGLDENKIEQIVELYFQELNKENSEAENWLIELLPLSPITKEIISWYIKNNLATIDIKKILNLITQIPFESYGEKIIELLASTDLNNKKIAIDTLDKLRQSDVSIPPKEAQFFEDLIRRLPPENFDKNKIEELKKYLMKFKND